MVQVRESETKGNTASIAIMTSKTALLMENFDFISHHPFAVNKPCGRKTNTIAISIILTARDKDGT